MKNIFCSIFLMVSILLTPVFALADTETYPWQQKYYLRDDQTGGECEMIGSWDQSSKTCTVSMDFQKGIEFESDNITLDGNGHKISGNIVGKEYLILIDGKSGVAVKNLNLERVGVKVSFSNAVVIENVSVFNVDLGVNMIHVSDSFIRDSKFTKFQAAIAILGGQNNQIIGNEISQNKGYFTYSFGNSGIYSSYSNGNTIEKNSIQDIENRAIWFNFSSFSVVKENVIEGTKNGTGFYALGGVSNEIFNNNFINNHPYQSFPAGMAIFNKPLPIGGNYWDDYDEELEGCFDLNENGICDEPNRDFAGREMDQYPFKKPFDLNQSGNSSILFIPGIQASRLYKKHKYDEDQLWEPTNRNEDVRELYLDEDGESVESGIYARDVIDEAYGVFNIYEGFMSFLDEMKEEKTINDWKALPYDWRYSPEIIIERGIVVDDGKIIDPIEKIKELAESSQNGKVTIISHSNGGIFAKLLVDELREKGKEELVEKIIFVATPQMGTPKTLAGLLHGDGLNIAHGVFYSKEVARRFGENMKSAYNLLPSEEYFEKISTPVIKFKDDVDEVYDFEEIYGGKIDSFSEMKEFVLGDDGQRQDPDFSDTDSPNVLSKKLFSEAKDLHDQIDSWQALEETEVIQVAGWGLDTVAGIEYSGCKSKFFCDGLEDLDRDLVITMDGDETVVYPSALMLKDAKKYYFDLLKNNDSERLNKKHANILEAGVVQGFIENIIQGKDELTEYISKEIPELDSNDKRLRLKMKSPVDVHLFDENGNHTGIIQSSNPASDLKMLEEQIPNSYYWEFGEKKYLGSGAEGGLSVDLVGTDTGTFTFEIEQIQGEESVNVTSFSDIPVFEGMEGHLSINDGEVGEMGIDLEGDGVTDFSINPGDDTMKSQVSILILGKIINDLNCHQKVKKPLAQSVAQAKKLFEQGKLIPAKNILESMISHLKAIQKTNDFEKLGISRERIEILMEIIDKVNLNI